MLTRSQIQRAAQKSGVGVQVQERDYLQHLLLWLLFSHGQTLVFGGGTALRMVYGGNRYAENLEFSIGANALSHEELHELWRKTVQGLEQFGVLAEMRNGRASRAEYSFDVGFRGPLYDGRYSSQGRARVNVHREPEVESRPELVISEYDDVRPFVATVLTPEQLMADKITALMVRGKPRDLYDLWLMLRLGVRPQHQLIEHKLAPYGIDWHLRKLVDALDVVQIGWDRNLRHLLPQYVPYQTARDGVVSWLVGI
jgi:predicted nucleotidyltransferase component of viral defense system